MYLQNIIINGFKSFGKSSNLKFDSKISAIVGPNGSGKSNIAEAFRFVLGEQSMKNMRGKKGTDLIFSGKNFNLNRASVEIIFDNSSKFLDIEYGKVIIERVVYKDGINEYFINKNKVRVKDIIELLVSANIGSTGYHIISQGEADKIISVNPKERKMIIEEALGLKSFVMKKIDAEKRLKKVSENLKEVKTNLKIISPRISFLKREVDKIERSKNLTLELKNLYKNFFYSKKEVKENYINLKKIVENKNLEKEKIEDDILDKKEEIKKLNFENLKQENNKNNQEVSKIKEELSNIFSLKSKTQKEVFSLQYDLNLFLKKEKEIEKKIKDGYNAKEIYDQKIEMVTVVLHHAWSLWASELLESGENISEERKKLWKKYFKSYADLSEKKKEHNRKISIEILNVLGIEEKSEEIEKLDKNIFIEYKNKITEKEQEITKLNISERELNERSARLNSGENILESKIKTIQIEILKLENILNKINSDIKFENLNIFSAENKLRDFGKEEAYVISKFGEKESQKIINYNFSESEKVQNQEKNIFEKILRIRAILENMGTNFSKTAEEEFEELNVKKEFVVKEINDLENSSRNIEEIISSLEKKITEKFHNGILEINKNFSEFFKSLFSGGDAELKVVKIPIKKDGDEFLQEYEFGIDLVVKLPNKKIAGLSMLSGGERSLVSIALLFAMSQVTPPPFIILDETDAALDEANSKRYGDMVEKLSEHSQLILITHNRETMARAGLLWGITMTENGLTKLLSVSLEQAQKVAK